MPEERERILPETTNTSTRLTVLVFALLVVLVAVGSYYNTLSAQFVNWDDNKLIVDNPYIRGLTSENLKYIWTKPIQETYLPLRATSYALDYHFWGLKPVGYHLTNVLINAIVSLLVFAVAKRLTGSLAAAAFAGLLFAVHPVHTEAVAWASGRKDVLSTALFLLAYLCFLWSYSAGRRKWLLIAASLVSFVLSGLAKAMVVTLPLLVILTDFLYGEGLGGGRWRKRLPVWAAYFAAAGAVTGIAMYFAASAGAIRPWHFGGAARTAVFMTWVALFYIKTMILPHALSARYPYGDTPDFGVNPTVVYLSPVALVVVLAAAAWLVYSARARSKSAASPWVKLAGLGIGWFFLTLLPVMNLVSINVLVADRYLYLPSAGFTLAQAAVFWLLWTEAAPSGAPARRATVPPPAYPGARKLAAALICAGIVIGYGARTFLRNDVWHDSRSLWESVVKESPQSAQARLLLASAYGDAEPPDLARALDEIARAATIVPLSGEPHLWRGKILSRMGKTAEAEAEFAEARRLGLAGVADVYETYIAEAAASEASGRLDAAAASLEKAILADPARPEAYNNYGRLSQRLGDLAKAERLYRQAVAKDPKFARGYYNLGLVAEQKRDIPAALGYYKEALDADPAYAEAMVNLAVLYLALGNTPGAVPLLEAAVALKPALVPAHVNLACAYAALNDVERTRRELEEALKLDPDNASAKEMYRSLEAMTQGGK